MKMAWSGFKNGALNDPTDQWIDRLIRTIDKVNHLQIDYENKNFCWLSEPFYGYRALEGPE